jgi:5-methyltetrahydropteroyltriglutamate--homocysteine methyltransferase
MRRDSTTAVLRRPLLTHELGSLAKPNWRVKAVAGTPLDDDDLAQARVWGERLRIPDHQELLDLLTRASSPLSAQQRAQVRRWSSIYAVRLLETAGLDVVYDGEQQRSEMYAWAVAHSGGFEWRGSVRAFDNRYYSKAAVTARPWLRTPWYADEFELVNGIAHAEVKVPITGAYTLADWSFDEHYDTAADLAVPIAVPIAVRRARARRDLVMDIARNLIRPNLQALLAQGARWVQVDEPGGSTEPHELDLLVDSFNASVAGLDAVFSTHLCFSDYRLFFPAIEQLTGCRQYAVGFANYDSRELGVSDRARPGYAVLGKFRDLIYQPVLGVGVLDIHSDFIEPPELVRDRVLYAVEVFGDPGRIHVTPDCGLRTRSWAVAYRKLTNMVVGVDLARSHLGL